jgi:HSP20 family protein
LLNQLNIITKPDYDYEHEHEHDKISQFGIGIRTLFSIVFFFFVLSVAWRLGVMPQKFCGTWKIKLKSKFYSRNKREVIVMKRNNFIVLFVCFLAVCMIVPALQAEIKDVLGDENKQNQQQKQDKNSFLWPLGGIGMPADPFFDSFEEEMDEMFKSFKGLRGMQMPDITRNMHGFAQGRSDVRVEGDNLVVVVDLPGHDKNSIDLRVKDNDLVISSERKSSVSEEEEDKFYRREISYGNFSRVIALPREVIEEKTSATYKNGVLKVILPIDKKAPDTVNGYRINIE